MMKGIGKRLEASPDEVTISKFMRQILHSVAGQEHRSSILLSCALYVDSGSAFARARARSYDMSSIFCSKIL